MLAVEGEVSVVVASDVHVGVSREAGPMGEEMVGGPAHLAGLLIQGARRAKTTRVLLLGDVKEPILRASPVVNRDLRRFFDLLDEEGLTVEVCRGNHDVALERSVGRRVTIHSSRGLLREGIGYFHGHAWPSPAILRQARTLIVGHLHPGFRLASGKQPCWVRSQPRPNPLFAATEVLVVPAFNPLCSSEALNLERPRRSRSFLVRRFLTIGESRAYLLDGTDLGPLDFQPVAREPRGTPLKRGSPRG